MIYRKAIQEDLPQIVDMAKDATSKAYSVLPFDSMIAFESIEEAIESSSCCVFVADDESVLNGFIIGQVLLSWFGEGLVAKDWITYAIQSAHPWTFYNLHKRYVAWAKDAGAHNLITSNFSGLSDRSMCKVLMRLGYTPSGTMAQQATV